MDRLWAPWRMSYILETVKQEQPEGCVFCRMLEESEDRKNLILNRADHCFTVMNLFPYNSGHLMIIPLRHTGDFGSLSAVEHAEMGNELEIARKALQECFTPHGFNIGMNIGRAAGAGIVDHLHYHIVPRWNGDSNFMSSVGETKVLSESLPESFARLKKSMERLRS
ncbi:MAG: HIT domain-containing protein [Calditrichaeota bacterium]|nr:HIT domain-containing protein [Calditrichota bacterium]MCB9368125.1 HIT domain-containing protein [Calditrichota bacterium]